MSEGVFVGRARELTELDGFFRCVVQGEGQVCLISGDAGTGKTALITAFSQHAQREAKNLVIATGNCNSQTGIGDPYLPFREVADVLTGTSSNKQKTNAVTKENTSRIKRMLSVSAQILIDVAPDLVETFVPGAALISKLGKSVAVQAGWTDQLESIFKKKAIERRAGVSSVQQNQIFEQYTNFLRRLSDVQPLMILLDDLQWADAASISLLFHLCRRISDKRIFIVGAFRPVEVSLGRAGADHPLESVLAELKRYYGNVVIDLAPTGAPSEQEFVDALIDAEPNNLSRDFRTTLYRQTKGNPLFTVELLNDMKEGGSLVRDSSGFWIEAPDLVWNKLPARVEGVIERRLNRLDEDDLSLLAVGSVEGESFTAEVIAHANDAPERKVVLTLSRDLDKQHRLVNARGVQRVGRQRLSLYQFQHNLFQKFIYNNLDEVERAYLHEDVGTVLEELYGGQADTIAVKLARHFKEAGINEKAVNYLYQAGVHALRLSAHHEAVKHFSHGLELLMNTFPATVERDQQELLFQTMLGQGLIATKGYAAPEVAVAYTRARKLCDQMGDTPQLFPVLLGLQAFYEVRGKYPEARQLGEQLVQMAEKGQDVNLLLPAHFALGNTLFLLGELAGARSQFEKVDSYYDIAEHSRLGFLYGQDPLVCALSWQAVAEWLQGYPEKALQSSKRAVSLARKLKHPFSLAYALYCATWLHQLRRDPVALQAQAGELITTAQLQGFPFWLALGLAQSAWAVARQGKPAEALAQLEQGLALYDEIGGWIGKPYYYGLMAEIQYMAGRIDAGLAVLTKAQGMVVASGERWSQAYLYYLEGELLLAQSPDNHDQARQRFLRAIEAAQQVGAKFFEQQAEMGLNCMVAGLVPRRDTYTLIVDALNGTKEGLASAGPEKVTAVHDGIADA